MFPNSFFIFKFAEIVMKSYFNEIILHNKSYFILLNEVIVHKRTILRQTRKMKIYRILFHCGRQIDGDVVHHQNVLLTHLCRSLKVSNY